jgi:hypothetical protein
VPVWLTPRRAAIAATAVLVIAYLSAVAGPLRVDVDSAALLRIGASLADGTGLHPPESHSLPPGYPALVAALDVVGIAVPPVFVLVALGSLAVALVAARTALRLDLLLTPPETTVAVLLTLVSVYAIKYGVLPLTEMPFFAVSALSLAALARARSGGSAAWLVCGVVLAGVSYSIRTAGIALGLAAVLAFPTAKGRVIAAAVGGAGAIAATMTASYYIEGLIAHWRTDPLYALWHEPYYLVRSSGAIAANIPISAWNGTIAKPVTLVAGCVLLAVVSWALWSRRRSLGPVDGFVIATLVIVLLFPYEHPRFLLPVVPYLIGYCVLAARRLPRVALVYALLFTAVGLTGLAASTRLSYSGDRFPERYADGALASTYRLAWGLDEEGETQPVDERVLWALRRYDPDPPGFP